VICQALSELGVNYLGVWAGFGKAFQGLVDQCLTAPRQKEMGVCRQSKRGVWKAFSTSEPAAHLSHFIPREKALGKDWFRF